MDGMDAGDGQTGNTSQRHGTDFENLVKTAHMFPGACNAHRSGVSVHDIEGRHDPVLGLDTSVKATGNGVVPLADGPRFYEINVVRRFIVGEWEQVDERIKLFRRIHHLITPLGALNAMRGDLTAAEVLDFHMRIASFPEGPEAANAARAEAEWIKKAIEGRHGSVRFDFKIDDHKQRRLQLTIGLGDMIAALAGRPDYMAGGHVQPLYTVHDREFCQYPLPIALISPRRRIETTPRAAEEIAQDKLFDLPASPAPTRGPARSAARRTPVRQDQRAAANGMDRDLQEVLFGA